MSEQSLKEENRKIMVALHDVEKVYRLGQIGTGTLRRDMQSWWAKKRGREDPNSIIGQAKRLEGDRFLALDHVSLNVYEGECLGIIGGNGAGKSTLLKLISRVTAPSGGCLDLYGRVTSMLEVGTGFHMEMTGRENIYLNGAILGMSKREIDEILEEIIDFSEVREFIDTPVKRYSSGMYVKLAFSVAAHLKSEIIIMDEVLAVGDIAFQKKCIDRMISAARDENRTVLYVSHNMSTVRALCDRCIVLDQGRIIFDGQTEEAIDYYGRYLLGQQSENKTELSDMRRRNRGLTGLITITDILADSLSVTMDGVVTYQVTLHSTAEMESIRLRLIISDITGVIIGMTYSEPFAVKKDTDTVCFQMDAEPLAPGNYVCDVAVCSVRDGEDIRHDFLSKVMSFQIIETRKHFGRNWKKDAWGSVILSPIHVMNNDER